MLKLIKPIKNIPIPFENCNINFWAFWKRNLPLMPLMNWVWLELIMYSSFWGFPSYQLSSPSFPCERFIELRVNFWNIVIISSWCSSIFTPKIINLHPILDSKIYVLWPNRSSTSLVLVITFSSKNIIRESTHYLCTYAFLDLGFPSRNLFC